MLLTALFWVTLFSLRSDARPGGDYDFKPYEAVLHARRNKVTSASSLQVDLGYEVYEGYVDNGTGLSNWNGYVQLLDD
jgi:hypothetical protein